MNNKPLVSIVIAFLNAQTFIQEAIESVLAQTYEYWELLLFDDGSTDEGSMIALKYSEQYPNRIHYLEHQDHQNRGVCASRNAAIRHSQGEYIAILDGDDVWLPHKLARQVEILNSYPEAGMVYGASHYFDTADPSRNFVEKIGFEANKLFQPPELVTLCYPLGQAAAPCPSNVLLRRDTIERVGGFEESFRGIYQLYEDQAFLMKVYLTTPVFVADECWDKYRQHANSCMARTREQASAIRLYFLNWLGDYLSKRQIDDPRIWKLFQQALWPYQHPILSKTLTGSRRIKWKIKRRLNRMGKQTRRPAHKE
jgi:glycosyltransferase involved in cell wall biosynthesis